MCKILSRKIDDMLPENIFPDLGKNPKNTDKSLRQHAQQLFNLKNARQTHSLEEKLSKKSERP